jgi:hypothetical protein
VASVTAEGGGTVKLTGANTFTGNTTIVAGTTLEIGNAGKRTIDFGTNGGTLKIDGSTMPANLIAGFSGSNIIDLANLAPNAQFASVNSGGTLSVVTTTGTISLLLAGSGRPIVAETSDGHGGTQLTPVSSTTTSFNASSETAINAVLSAIDVGGLNAHTNTAYTLVLSPGTIGLTTDLLAVNLPSGSSLTVLGNGAVIDGGYISGSPSSGTHGFFAYSGSLTLHNLTIRNAVARGGAGGSGYYAGGGGAGMGGGLFVNNTATVTLSGVSFLGDKAIGGAGGLGTTGKKNGGGGGLGGAGGNGTASFAGGGDSRTTDVAIGLTH